MKEVWLFIQNQILGLNWLNDLIGSLLTSCGLDTTSNIGASVHKLAKMYTYLYSTEIITE